MAFGKTQASWFSYSTLSTMSNDTTKAMSSDANGPQPSGPEPGTYPKPGRGRPPKAKDQEANGSATSEPKAKKPKTPKPQPNRSLETWIWDAACSIRGAKDAPKYKDYILPLIFTKRLCDVFDDELDRIAGEVGSREKAFRLVQADKKLVRFYLPLEPKEPTDSVWSVIRTLSDKIGEERNQKPWTAADHLRPKASTFAHFS